MLGRDFFARDVLVVARELIGKELRWGDCAGLIVETEAYGVTGDAACHTATRKGAREFYATNKAGTAYVYLNYGVYWLLNVLAKPTADDSKARHGIVLIRALEPTEGLDQMRDRRNKERPEDLCSGPGKLGVALGIGADDHGIPLVGRGIQTHFRAGRPVGRVCSDVRVGISKAKDFRWRFLAKGNPHVSVPLGKVK